jgi:hypothetical protein
MSLRSTLVSTTLAAGAVLASGLQPTAAFDLAAYRDHLGRVRDLEARPFIDFHRPYGPYVASLSGGGEPEYLDSLTMHFELRPGELHLLRRHGFMVSERLRFPSYGEALLNVWRADMPVFVSSDAILHALHRSYVDILGTIEKTYIALELRAALDAMHDAWPALDQRYRGVAGMRASLDDADVYLTVARSLLAGEAVPSRGGNDAAVAALLAHVEAERPLMLPLFNTSPRIYDFSQMRPRGHYTQSEALQRYFRAMMWLGRTELRLSEPPGEPATPDVSREIVDAFLMRALATGPAGLHLQNIDRVIRALVGAPDNVTFDQLDRIAAAIGMQSPDHLLRPQEMARFRAELATGDYSEQAINSQILLNSPMSPERLTPPHAFLVMGQRFILDSYVAWNVVYDRIEYQNRLPFRGLPAALDVLYALGNDDALPLLRSELDTYHYAANLSALRYLIDGYEPDFWRQSLYTVWLQAIRTLAKSGRQNGAPDFMRTAAWQHEKMNSQLASWTELRHDNLLYAKQSYTGGVTCSYPRTYIEPVPELYRVLQNFAIDAGALFGSLPSPASLPAFFHSMEMTMGRLATIAAKELSGATFTAAELQFLREVLAVNNICGEFETGWYRQLFYSGADMPVSESDLLVADVHTQPTDEFGNPVGHVLHVATGSPEMGVFVAAPPGQPLTAFAGPVASYNEHVTADFERLTDEEWEQMYAQAPPARPDWTHAYLADAQGGVRTTGRRLEDEIGGGGPAPVAPPAAAVRVQLAANVPNPFNPETRIPFQVDAAGPIDVRLSIFDARGRFVRELLHEVLPPNTYHARWDGRDARGSLVASGVYHAVVRAGNVTAGRKMALLK